jgi:adenylate cyclase
VLFGAPDLQPAHAARAVDAALDIISQVRERRERWSALDAPNLRVGIGIHTGKVVVGTVGSRNRLDYTAIGDTTNTAARIEAATKELQAEIVISEATVMCVPEVLQRLPHSRREIFVKGKDEPLTVYKIAPPAAADGLALAFADVSGYTSHEIREDYEI